MTRWLAALAGAGVAQVAMAAPTVVWLTPDLPEASLLEKADHQTGGTAHVTWYEIAFAPQPITEADREAVLQVQEAVENAYGRWNDFEVELPLAADLAMTVADVDTLADVRDVDALVTALLLQGSAELRAFDAAEFAVDERAAGLRAEVGGVAVPTSWVDAWALAKGAGRGSFVKSDFIDAAAFADWKRLSPAITGVGDAMLTWDPRVGQVVVDGKPIDGASARLVPGLHRLHVLRDGVAAGRVQVRVAEGQQLVFPMPISVDDVDVATARVRAGEADGLPSSVVAGMDALAGRSDGGALYLAAPDGSKVDLLEFTASAKLASKRLATLVLTADIGGGIQMSSLYEEADGANRLAGAMSGGFGLDVGISYFLISLGMDASVTPGSTVLFANDAGTDNVGVSVYPQPHVGLGAYFLRPVADTPTVSLQADVAWLGPAHLTYGGRLAIGVPIDAKKNWFRVVLGGSYGPSSLWKLPDEPVSVTSAWLRVGVGAGL